MPCTLREKIIENATELFLQFGVNNVRVDEILNAVGCGKSAFYKEFSSKEDLLEVCLIGYNRRWISAIFNDPSGASTGDEVEYSENSLEKFRENAERSLEIFRANVESGNYKGSLVLSVLFQEKANERLREVALKSHQEVLSAISNGLKVTSMIAEERLAAMMLLLLQGTSVSILRGKTNAFDAAVMGQRILLSRSFADVPLSPTKESLQLLIDTTSEEQGKGLISPRERLSAAADKLFGCYGSSQVGLKDLLVKADVARATLYDHFGSKDALVKEFLDRRGKEKHQIFDWLIKQESIPLELRLQLLFKFLKEYYFRESSYGPIYLTELFQLRDDCEIRQIAESGMMEFRNKLQELISQDNLGSIERKFGDIAFQYLQGALVGVVLRQPSSFDLAASAVIGTMRTMKQA